MKKTLLCITALFMSCAQLSAQVNAKLVPPDESFEGITYADALRGFWQWSFAFPGDNGNNVHPLLNGDGSSMGINNDGPVYFLSKSWRKTGALPEDQRDPVDLQENRKIQVRADQAIFAPLNGWVTWPRPTSAPELFDPANRIARIDQLNHESSFEIRLVVDGEEIAIDNSLDSPYFIHTGAFPVNYPNDSGFLAVEGLTPESPDHPSNYETPNEIPVVVNQDFMALIKPLSVGDHVVEIFGQTMRNDALAFTTDVRYNISVVPEPSSLLGAVLGITCLVGVCRRSRRGPNPTDANA